MVKATSSCMATSGQALTRRLCRAVMFVAGWSLAALVHAADPWPSKPIRIIVPVAAGSASDLVARQLAPRLASELGQAVVIDNRPGADMAIGISAVAKAPADGYTWLLVSSTFTSSTALRKVPYDPIKDFVAVGNLGYATTVAVVPATLGVRTMKEFVSLAKSKPAAINFANPSIGSLGHLNAVLLERAAGISMTAVPYKGSSPAIMDLLAGRVDFMMAPPGVALPYVKEGKLVALGVVGPQRLPLYPGTPTMGELDVKGVDLEAWMGVLMPVGTAPGIVDRAHVAIDAALRGSGASAALETAGLRAAPGEASGALAQQIRTDMLQWPKLFELAKVSRED